MGVLGPMWAGVVRGSEAALMDLIGILSMILCEYKFLFSFPPIFLKYYIFFRVVLDI